MRRYLLPLLWLLGQTVFGGEPPQPAEAMRLQKAKALLELPALRKQQKGLVILGQLTIPAAGQLLTSQFDRLERGTLPLGLWLEVLESARRFPSLALQRRVGEYEKQIAADHDPVRAWRECLEGGDAEEGRDLFFHAPEAGCIRCHSINGEGGRIGPELAGLGLRTDRLYILESIIEPNASIVMAYGQVMLTMKNGETMVGLVASESRDGLSLISIVDGTRQTVLNRDVAGRTSMPSAMPPIFKQALTKRQLRDLVEFIATMVPIDRE